VPPCRDRPARWCAGWVGPAGTGREERMKIGKELRMNCEGSRTRGTGSSNPSPRCISPPIKTIAYEGDISSQLPPKLPPLFEVVPDGKSSHESRRTTTATRPSGSHRIDRGPHRGSLITFLIATDIRSRLAYRRRQAIRARIEYRARTGRGVPWAFSPRIRIGGLRPVNTFNDS
jgi:hypothetical protein